MKTLNLTLEIQLDKEYVTNALAFIMFDLAQQNVDALDLKNRGELMLRLREYVALHGTIGAKLDALASVYFNYGAYVKTATEIVDSIFPQLVKLNHELRY